MFIDTPFELIISGCKDCMFFRRYINDFLRSEFHCKHQIDVLTSGNVQLTDILYNETAFFYFMEVCIILYNRSLLQKFS